MQIFELEDKPKWIEATQPLWEKYYEKVGYDNYAQGKALVERLLKFTR